MFEGPTRLVHHFAPPILNRVNNKGEPVKQRFGPWVRPLLGVLARLKFLRGTALDVFGRTAERRMERALIIQYEDSLRQVTQGLTPHTLDVAVQIARLPEDIRGYGHVKARHVQSVQARWTTLLSTWSALKQSQSA